MQISFFEEFPNKESLDKLKFLQGRTKLYIAARSLGEFYKIVGKVKGEKVKEFIYWPILNKKEGYWISPFSNRKALKRIFDELEGKKAAVMLDLELPTSQNVWLYFTQLLNFFMNKRLVKDFIENYNGEIYLAEYYPEGKWKERIMEMLGIHYKIKKVKVIKMVYHSLHNFNKEFLIKEWQRGKEEFGENYLVALGTIAKGITGKEHILDAKQLSKDLELCEKQGIKEVIIFRLGGLNKEYYNILNKF